MEKYILLSLLLLFSCNKTPLGEETDWSKENLSGKVKKYIEQQYKPLEPTTTVQGIESLGLLQKNTCSFNENGYCVEMVHHARGEDAHTKHVFEYNEQFLLIKEDEYKSGEDAPMTTEEFIYDEKGELTEQRSYEYKKLTTTTLLVSDPIQHTTLGTVYAADNSVISNFTMQYDPKGNLIDEIRYNKNQEHLTYRIYKKYDENFKLRSVEDYQATSNSFSISQRNGKEQEIALKKYIGGIILSACLYEYDDKGNQTNTSCDIYENQSKKNIQSINQYEYDEQGNWVRRITFQDNLVSYVVERTYVYY